MTPTTAQNMAERMAEFYQVAGEDPELSQRMCFAQTIVHIRFTDDPQAGVTIWLDRAPITAEPQIVGEAEIELYGHSDAFGDMIKGTRELAMAIVAGDVTYTGPVRKFLRVVPILRSFDFAMWRERTNGAGASILGTGSGSSSA